MITDQAFSLLKVFEGCELKAYKCPAGITTIGYGATRYKDGSEIQMGDKITQKRADELLQYQLQYFERAVKNLIKVDLTEHQLSALVLLTYNIGVGNLSKSTLLKMLNKNPNDPALKVQWLKWCYAGGKIMKGLIRRRIEEWQVYITKD